MQAARQRCDEVSREKSRVSGELDAARRRYSETEQKCREAFDCAPDELPALRKQMEAEGRRLVEEAEAVLAGGSEAGTEAEGAAVPEPEE